MALQSWHFLVKIQQVQASINDDFKTIFPSIQLYHFNLKQTEKVWHHCFVFSRPGCSKGGQIALYTR